MDKDYEQLDELSTDKLAQYKKKAGEDASAADSRGDYKRGNKRFAGIIKATKKQFKNELKETQLDKDGYPIIQAGSEDVPVKPQKGPKMTKKSEVGIDEAIKASLTKWKYNTSTQFAVIPQNVKQERGSQDATTFPLHKYADAKAHADKTGGKLVKVDNAGKIVEELDTPQIRALRSVMEAKKAAATEPVAKDDSPPKFKNVFCSQCGQKFGPGNSGFSACKEHRKAKVFAISEEVELEESFDVAEKHKAAAEKAKAKGNMGAFHAHMADHHEAMAEWNASKGRHSVADKHAEKAEEHHEASLKHPYVKEETEKDEAPKHQTWAVKPKNPRHFMKYFPPHREDEARAHAKATGGKLLKVDQHGRVMKEDRISEGLFDFIKDLTRDKTQKIIKQAWKVTYWPKHIEPALKKITVKGQPFHKMVLGDPKVVENSKSKTALLKQYTVDLVFSVDPSDWNTQAVAELNRNLTQIENAAWNKHKEVVFDTAMLSFQYTKADKQDLVIPVRLSSLDSNIKEETEMTIDQLSEDFAKKVQQYTLGQIDSIALSSVMRQVAETVSLEHDVSLQEALEVLQQFASEIIEENNAKFNERVQAYAEAVKSNAKYDSEVGQLDEISKDTAKSYYGKAMSQERAREDGKRTKGIKAALARIRGQKKTNEEVEQIDELKGNQHKIDANKNGKVDAHDFKLLRAKKDPFEGGKEKPETVVDKSGAKHTPMSRARDLARRALKKEEIEINEASKGDKEHTALQKFMAARRLKQAEKSGTKKSQDWYNKQASKKNLPEEVEQIDELKKSTIGSYIKKASHSVADNAWVAGTAQSHVPGETEKLRAKAFGKANKRIAGIARAADRLAKEEVEQIDEMQQGKTYSQDHLKKKIQSGNWEAVTDIKPGKTVEMRHHTGKRVMVQVKEESGSPMDLYLEALQNNPSILK